VARQAVRGTKEATVGAFDASALAASITYPRLVGDNAFGAQPTPNISYVRDAAGSNRRVQAVHGNYATKGKLATLGYYSQAKLLLPWACNLINDTGGNLKPAYTMTFDWQYQLEDSGGTMAFRRFLGAYCEDFTFKASNSGDGVKWAADFGFNYLTPATITVTDFAMPTLDKYPADQPAIFQQAAGLFTLGSSRVGFRSLEISVKNIFDVIYDEGTYPQAIKWCGRDVSFKTVLRFKSLGDRTDFEAVTAKTASIAITDGTTTITFDFKTNSIFGTLGDELPLGKAHYQNTDLMVMLDSTAGTDLAVTIAP
jgi:hypothetical protein